MIRIQPRTSPDNYKTKLPWIRRKKLRDQFSRNPQKMLHRFQELLCRFQCLIRKNQSVELYSEKQKKIRRNLFTVSSSLMDYLECGVLDMERDFHEDLRRQIQPFL